MSAKQRLLLTYLASSPDIFALTAPIIKPDYFDPELRKSVAFMVAYHDQYSDIPSPAQIEAETNTFIDKLPEVSPAEHEYALTEIELFCRRKALLKVALDVPQLAEEDRGAEIEERLREALCISVRSSLGTSYFDTVQERLDRLTKQELRTSVGWPNMDAALGGGLARQELLLFTANSGGGKSVAMSNMAASFADRGFNVVYISLELSEDLVSQRFDAIYTGINSTPYVVWKTKHKQIVPILEKHVAKSVEINGGKGVGRLDIVRMPTATTALQIRAYLREYVLRYRIKPDLLVVDYLDLMGTNENISVENISQKDKRATEQLRDLLMEYNMFGVTASQQNREAINATELHQGHIAGGMTKVNTVDWHISIVFNDMMREAKEMMMVILKARSSDATGKKLSFRWDSAYLRIRCLSADDLYKEAQERQHTPPAKANSLADFDDI